MRSWKKEIIRSEKRTDGAPRDCLHFGKRLRDHVTSAENLWTLPHSLHPAPEWEGKRVNQGLMKKVLCFLDTETPRRLSCLGLAALITTKEPWTLGSCNWPFELNFFEFKESHNCKPYIFFFRIAHSSCTRFILKGDSKDFSPHCGDVKRGRTRKHNEHITRANTVAFHRQHNCMKHEAAC